jgi:hypothetical protein
VHIMITDLLLGHDHIQCGRHIPVFGKDPAVSLLDEDNSPFENVGSHVSK